MVKRMLKIHKCFAVCAFLAPVFAMDPSQWTNVQTLSPGDRVGVVQMNRKRIEGRFQGSTDSAITIQADHEVSIPKTEVVRVYKRGRMTRTTRAAIGAAAGVAAGAILSATAGDRFRNEGQDPQTAAWIAGGAGIGAAVGALTGSGYREIYRRPAP